MRRSILTTAALIAITAAAPARADDISDAIGEAQRAYQGGQFQAAGFGQADVQVRILVRIVREQPGERGHFGAAPGFVVPQQRLQRAGAGAGAGALIFTDASSPSEVSAISICCKRPT